ncbi:unnamed protein product [Phyllotreta striolata]|uniref:Uncharacterized protein n=1 Tax=Phyllotreta striolata TaxID=444603 RepID=A0A9N9TGX4_PHYSR|nr:unnamed protein product [Phyllotreta striolata]
MSKSTANASAQTIIKVHPHLLEADQISKVTTDRRQGTVLSVGPRQEQHFYSLLRFTPFSDIKENSVRILDIPRSKRLQFNPINVSEEMESKAKMFSLADDDGAGFVCCSVIRREMVRDQAALVGAGTQTDVAVSPHILDENNVAYVYGVNGSIGSKRN